MTQATRKQVAIFLSIGATVAACLLMMGLRSLSAQARPRAHPVGMPHTQSSMWITNSNIISGLVYAGNLSSPSVFQMDSTWYLVSGKQLGTFSGYHWDGSAWVSDSSIISGLSDAGILSAPEAFQMDSTWYMIVGSHAGVAFGYRWGGSSWVSDSDIVSGTNNVGFDSTHEVFQMDSTWYLISFGNYGPAGYHWDGSAWVSDSDIIDGLDDKGNCAQTVFQMDSTWYWIDYNSNGFNGYYWNSSTWISDTAIVDGLAAGSFKKPDAFQMGSTWYLISGNGNGLFTGYHWGEPPTPTPTPTATPLPHVHIEAKNPQGTPAAVWELGKVESGNTSRCNACDSFTDWIITSDYGVFVDSGQTLGHLWSHDVALGDLDDDGDLDAFVANGLYEFGNANKVWLNDSTGSFTDSGQNLGDYSSTAVALGDLDDDDDLDAFVVNYETREVWLNDGTGVFTNSGQSLGGVNSVWGVALGDLDDDDDLDAFVVGNGSNTVWLNDGTGVFTDSGQLLGDSYSYDVALGDLDDDDDLDAFVVGSDYETVWLNDGTGVFTDSGQSLGNIYVSAAIALGDLDDDDDLDAFIANAGSEPDTVWLNNGTGVFTDSGQNLISDDSYDVALDDLDGDGDLDAFVVQNIVYSYQEGHKIWLNDGAGNFTDSEQELPASQSWARGVALGDLDDDGDLDAFVAHRSSVSGNRVWLNTYVSAYIVAYSNQMILGATLEPPSGQVVEMGERQVAAWPGKGSSEYNASFVVATLTPTPTPVYKELDVTIRDETLSPVMASVILVESTGEMGPVPIASCFACSEILDVDLSSYDYLRVRVFPYHSWEVSGLYANPQPDAVDWKQEMITWYSLDADRYDVQFVLDHIPTPTPTPYPTPKFETDLFRMPLRAMNPIEFPAAPVLPSFPQLKWPDGTHAPALPTLDLGDLPTLEPLVIPTIDFPPIPDFEPPEFPATFTLHAEAFTLPVVTLPNSLTIDAMIPISDAPPLTQEWGTLDIMAYANLTLSADAIFDVTPLTTPVSLTISITPPTFPLTFDLPTAISIVNTAEKSKQIHDKFAEATTKALSLKATIVATTGDLDSIKSKTLAGKTADEMADEMADGFDVALSYLRGVSGIAIIGPTLAAVLVGLGWVTLVTTGKFLVKGTLSIIGIALAIWDRIPFKFT